MSPVRKQLQRSQRSWEVTYRQFVMLRVILSHPVLFRSFINNLGVNTKWIQTYIKLLLICRYIYLKFSAHFVLMKWLMATFPDNGKVDRKINTNKCKKVRQWYMQLGKLVKPKKLLIIANKYREMNRE